MRARPSRGGGVALAVIAGVWTLLLLPTQVVVWSGAGAPAWALAVFRTAPYRWVRGLLADIGMLDLYLVFGASAGLSFLLLWLATGPALARVGWSGRVFGAIILVLAPLTVLSYVNHSAGSPLRFLWGSEGLGLVVLALWGVVAAFAPGARRLPLWEALVLGLSLPLYVVAVVVSTYWPHGPIVAIALQAIALDLWAPRLDDERDSAAAA